MKVISVNISEKKGTIKTPVPSITLKKNHGIIGDAHAGNWHRQVSLLAIESLNKMKEKIPGLKPGDFAENIMTEGITLHTLPIGTILEIGECELEVTQIGKECHKGCEIRNLTGECIMPTEGIFAIVKKEGEIFPEDKIRIKND
ncbi:MOSC domain-containing protein [Anaerococcus sp. NML200537]|uniref:MOSC domain-containing protein n=1 Tax=Anaerococcus sp. NML200537 TaxID=2954485 RepID=UPI002237BCF8|nr:MOSC domain-containing protein [Anaerococcus sp. NML200537]MCW6700841.1 MOSC domain-containing protein [Anaerococcus sp. NML200537]